MNANEKTTTITFNEENELAHIVTYSIKLKNRLKKLAEEYPDRVKDYDDATRNGKRSFDVPKEWLKVTPKREMSEEQRAALAERARENLHRP